MWILRVGFRAWAQGAMVLGPSFFRAPHYDFLIQLLQKGRFFGFHVGFRVWDPWVKVVILGGSWVVRGGDISMLVMSTTCIAGLVNPLIDHFWVQGLGFRI